MLNLLVLQERCLFPFQLWGIWINLFNILISTYILPRHRSASELSPYSYSILSLPCPLDHNLQHFFPPFMSPPVFCGTIAQVTDPVLSNFMRISLGSSSSFFSQDSFLRENTVVEVIMAGMEACILCLLYHTSISHGSMASAQNSLADWYGLQSVAATSFCI